MKGNLKRIWHDPVWSKVIATAIISILGFIVTVGWNWLDGGNTIQDSLKLVFAYKVSLWLVLVILIVVLFGRGLKIRHEQNKDNVLVPPFVNDFTRGSYQNQIWKWRWQWSPTYQFYYVTDLNVECPNCHEGVLSAELMSYRCAKCNVEFSAYQMNVSSAAVAKQILQDARDKYSYCSKYLGKLPTGIKKS